MNNNQEKTMKKLPQLIKDYRIFSISAFIFAANLLHEFVNWVMDKSTPNELGDGVVVTGIITALVALVKFIFEFAVRDSDKKENKE